jgi:hypothetical protein
MAQPKLRHVSRSLLVTDAAMAARGGGEKHDSKKGKSTFLRDEPGRLRGEHARTLRSDHDLDNPDVICCSGAGICPPFGGFERIMAPEY